MGRPGHQAQLLQLQPRGPVGVEVAVGSWRAVVGPQGEGGLWAQGPPRARVGLKPEGQSGVGGQGTAGPRGRRQTLVLGVAARRGAAEGVGGRVVAGRAATATEAAGRGAAACSGLQGCHQPGRLWAHHRLGGGIEVAKLLVEQLHRRARKLGEDVPVDVSAEPGEAAGEEESEGWVGEASRVPSPPPPTLCRRPPPPPQAPLGEVGSRLAGGKDLTLALPPLACSFHPAQPLQDDLGTRFTDSRMARPTVQKSANVCRGTIKAPDWISGLRVPSWCSDPGSPAEAQKG